jgi:hypothetical protein
MLHKFSLILLTTLFLFGCAYPNKKVDRIGFKESKSSIKNSRDLDNTLLKIQNQKQAVEFLGEPVEKSVYILEWTTNDKPYYEYVENWKWEKSSINYLLFNKEGKVHDKINIIVMSGDYDKVKGIKDLRLND